MPGHRRNILISAAVLVLAFGLRFLGSLDDLWLDEIWTLSPLVLGRVTSVWEIFFSIKDENNHFLNTLWMDLLGHDADRVWIRLPPVILGSLTVLLARQAVAKSGPVAVWAVTVLMLPSYLLIHYSSEARGYAYQMFFALAAYVLMEQLLKAEGQGLRVKGQTKGGDSNVRPLALSTRPLALPWLFGVCCVLGCLSQPAFLLMFVALGGWAAVAALRATKSWFQSLRWLIGVFLAPTLILGAFYLLVLRHLVNGGGPPENPWIIAVSTLSLMVGGPEYSAADPQSSGFGAGDLTLLIGAFVAIAVFVQLVRMIRAGDDRAVCWLLMIVLPLAYVLITDRKEVYPRYFLGTVVLLDLALAELAAWCFRAGRAGRIAVCALLLATLVGNGLQLSRFYRFGRGHGQAVVEFLRDGSGGGPIVVGSDQSFRHALLLEYFGGRLDLLPRLIYFGQGPWPQAPQWLLLHSQDHAPQFEDDLTIQGHRYHLRRVFPYAGLSGWHTAVYERE